MFIAIETHNTQRSWLWNDQSLMSKTAGKRFAASSLSLECVKRQIDALDSLHSTLFNEESYSLLTQRKVNLKHTFQASKIGPEFGKVRHTHTFLSNWHAKKCRKRMSESTRRTTLNSMLNAFNEMLNQHRTARLVDSRWSSPIGSSRVRSDLCGGKFVSMCFNSKTFEMV